MKKRNLKIIATLAITFSLGLGGIRIHAAMSSITTSINTQKVEHKCNPAYSVLKNKLGFTETQIDDAAKAGKTAFDLAKEKGMTADQLRTAIIDAKSQKIDKMVNEGKITKDKADTIKADFPSKIQKWDGNLKQHKGHHFNIVYSTLQSKLGLTKTQIDDAAKAGKTAFDLAKEKGMTSDQLRAAIIDAKSERLDKMVNEGKLTKDKANTIKSDWTEKIQKWDGSLTHKTNESKSN